ncbi:hypothetical protein [Limisphaera sp. 4302-co]|uniref:hypothetical protein n=1 Tax=Limisphaera sp. 4302-co TaxID=3400417 RepID=UPI003C25664B
MSFALLRGQEEKEELCVSCVLRASVVVNHGDPKKRDLKTTEAQSSQREKRDGKKTFCLVRVLRTSVVTRQHSGRKKNHRDMEITGNAKREKKKHVQGVSVSSVPLSWVKEKRTLWSRCLGG